MNRAPDAGTLDQLVIGAGDADDAAWKALVTQPGGAEAWSAAVARRRRLDAVAGAVRGREWLARALRDVSSASRRLRVKPAAGIFLAFPDAQLDVLATAVLGPADHAAHEEISPAWGRIIPVRVQLGVAIALQTAADQVPVDVRYVCGGQDGRLSHGAWRLERGEAPVLLLDLLG